MADVKEINVGGVAYAVKDEQARALAGSLAVIETSPATANHAVGTYLVYESQLYQVTTAITAGTTLNGKITAVNFGDKIYNMNLVTAIRRAETVTTGSTGNIALNIANDGYTAVICPFASGATATFRAWVSPSNNNYFLTAINPNTGATINNTELNIRYWVVTFAR